MDETHLHFNFSYTYYRLFTDPKKMVLEAIADDKVEERLFDEDNSRQLWRKGCENNQGYFTLENYEAQMFLTATEDNLEIVSKSELVILEYKQSDAAESGEFVKKKKKTM